METQEIKPLLDKLNPPHRFYRINTANGRLYYRKDESGKVFTYISATTFVRSVLPTPKHLIEWIRQQGGDYEKVLDLSANYGTTLHYLCAQLMVDKSLDLDRIDKMIEPFALQEGFKYWKQSWADDLKSDLLCFAKFVNDVNFEPLGIEMVLACERLGVAGALDYVGYMDIEVDGFSETEKFKTGARAGEFKPEKKKKRILVIVDLKSGKKGFHQDHVVQLAIHKEALLETFPEFAESGVRVFNFSPKDWRTEPSYNLKDQTDEMDMQLLKPMYDIAQIQEKKKDRMVKVFKGVVSLNSDVTENYEYTSLNDLLKTI